MSTTDATADWDEVLQFDLPGKEYIVEMNVGDENPEADTEFLGQYTIDLSITPESDDVWVPLKPKVTRRSDIRFFEARTGGKGILNLSWSMKPRLQAGMLIIVVSLINKLKTQHRRHFTK